MMPHDEIILVPEPNGDVAVMNATRGHRIGTILKRVPSAENWFWSGIFLGMAISAVCFILACRYH